MVYVGSKNRLAKYIVPILQEIIDKRNILIYIEPFVGGANIIDKISCLNKTGYDIHHELIGIYLGIQKGFIPPLHITEKDYNNARKGEIKEPLRSYIGFQGSYATKWWGGFARGFKSDNKTPRDIYNERTRNFLKQIPKLKNIKFAVKDYKRIDVRGALIYCDPPYYSTTGYKNDFDHLIFWDWVRNQSKNNIVLVSEFIAPIDFKVLWEKERTCSLDQNTGNLKKVERLFTINSL